MKSRTSRWARAAYGFFLRGPKPQLLETNLRLRWVTIAFGVVATIAIWLLFGLLQTFWAALAIVGLHITCHVLLSFWARRTERLQTIGALYVMLDMATVTALLAILGQLEGPLLGFYAIVILTGATMWSMAATGIGSALGFGIYAATLYATMNGLWPAGLAVELGAEAAVPRWITPVFFMVMLMIFSSALVVVNVEILRRRAELAEGKYQVVFQSMQTPVFVFDRETGRYLDANDAALKEARITRDQLRSIEAGDLAMPGSKTRVRDWLRRKRSGKVAPTMHHIVTRDGRDRYIEITLAPVEYDGHDAMVVSFRDRTEGVLLEASRRKHAETLEKEVAKRTQDLEQANASLRELQSQIVQAEKIGIAGEMAGGIAHAIYNPLTVLIGTVQMQLERGEGRPSDQRVLQLAQRINEVVEGMLTLSRRGEMKPQEVFPSELIGMVREELRERAKKNQVEVESQFQADLPPIWGDKTLLATALGSLAENAVDAMSDGGKLLLEASLLPDAEVMRFRVQDTGPGISEEIQKQMFEAFYSTKQRGAGLGLAIARGIVLGHEGTITCHSERGVGTELIVELPLRGIRESLRSAAGNDSQ